MIILGTWVLILSVLKEPIDAKRGIYQVHKFLESKKISLIIGDELILEPLNETDEPYQEEVHDANDAFRTLYQSPKLGSLGYSFPSFSITVYFRSTGNAMLEVIQISVSENSISEHQNQETEFKQLAIDLHAQFKSRRTILGWELDNVGFAWTEELARVRSGIFLEHESLELDLRN